MYIAQRARPPRAREAVAVEAEHEEPEPAAEAEAAATSQAQGQTAVESIIIVSCTPLGSQNSLQVLQLKVLQHFQNCKYISMTNAINQ